MSDLQPRRKPFVGFLFLSIYAKCYSKVPPVVYGEKVKFGPD